nr:MAK10-like protein [Tanacetum cinerariifolium]
MDFAKPVKAITLPQDVSSTSNRCLIELETQVQHLMKDHLAPTQPTEVKKVTTSFEIYIGPHDTQCCMENPKQAFVDYTSSCIDEAKDARLSSLKPISNDNKIGSPILQTRFFCSKKNDGEVMFIENIRDDDELQNMSLNEGEGATTEGPAVEYFDTFPTRDELTYHRKLDPKEKSNGGVSNFTGRIKGMHVFVGNFTHVVDFMIVEDISSIIYPRFFCSKENDGEVMFIEIIRDDDELQNTSLNEGEGATTKGPAVEYFDTFPTRDELTYHREKSNGEVSNFTGRIKGMHVFVGNFTYVVDFMIVEDISSIIDHRLSQVVLGRPFIEAFGRFTRDLGSFGEETNKTTNLHQHLSRISTQQLETASQFLRDAITTHPTKALQDIKTALEIMTQPII